MKKTVKCDKCNIKQKNETDGTSWEEFADNFEDVVKAYWLCNVDTKKMIKTFS